MSAAAAQQIPDGGAVDGAAVLSVRGLRKEFPGVVALDDVDFDVRPGEVHALLGANGAGKSTLIKIVSSLYQADGGAVFLEGEQVSFGSTAEAIAAGISVIYQDFALVPDLTAAENIFLGSEIRGTFGVIDRAAQRREAERLLGMVGA
ncbi:ATP-binding cassette domain-containing protein, partial [Brevirhabdus sp.]|uniref:ATP-binding cassette domain-containing protein n=1 Tax=Brevirhabdus sp. TaxID=2004514 RepID=UPI004059C55C